LAAAEVGKEKHLALLHQEVLVEAEIIILILEPQERQDKEMVEVMVNQQEVLLLVVEVVVLELQEAIRFQEEEVMEAQD
jgi:hypothetical protein